MVCLLFSGGGGVEGRRVVCVRACRLFVRLFVCLFVCYI